MTEKNYTIEFGELETPLIEIKKHPIIYLFPISILLGVILLSLGIFIFRDEIVYFIGEAVFWGCVSIFWIITLSLILFVLIGDHIDRLILTNMRVIYVNQEGLLSQHVYESSIVHVQEVAGKKSGILETIIGYGSIHISTAANTSNISIQYIGNPIETARRINNIISEYRNGKSQKTASEKPKETL